MVVMAPETTLSADAEAAIKSAEALLAAATVQADVTLERGPYIDVDQVTLVDEPKNA